MMNVTASKLAGTLGWPNQRQEVTAAALQRCSYQKHLIDYNLKQGIGETAGAPGLALEPEVQALLATGLIRRHDGSGSSGANGDSSEALGDGVRSSSLTGGLPHEVDATLVQVAPAVLFQLTVGCDDVMQACLCRHLCNVKFPTACQGSSHLCYCRTCQIAPFDSKVLRVL